MTRRDAIFLQALAALLLAAFSPLWLHLSWLPGNFGDIYGYHYPLRHLVTSTLQAGRLPLWNPYIFAGTPLAANPQSVLFYPPSMLHYFFPLTWALNLDAIFHAALAAGGAYLLLRKWRLDPLGSWMLALSYGFSPFLICRISQGVPTLLAALGWAPWVWLGLLSSSAPLLGGTLALQIFSGHAQFALINLAFMGLWTIWKRPARWKSLALSGLWAAGLAAVQTVPTAEFLRHSIRVQWNAVLSTGYSLSPAFLLTMVYPNVFGNPFQTGFPLLPSEFFEMLVAYIGLVPLGLAVVALRRSRQARRLWILASVGVFFALGGHNPLYIPLQKILGLDFFRIPARFVFFAVWGLWLAAAAGWLAVRPKLSPAVKILLALMACVDILRWSVPWIYSRNPMQFLSSNPRIIRRLRDGPWRFATSPNLPAPDKAMLHRLFNATGYEAFYPWPIAAYTARSERAPAADGSRTYVTHIDTPEMSRLSVRYFVSLKDDAGGSMEPASRRSDQRLLFTNGAASLYENPEALPLVQTDDPNTAWSMASPEHWAVSLARPAHVVFSQAAYPGWRAWANGRPATVSDEDGMFPSVSPHENTGLPVEIHFRFMPRLWFLSLALTLAAFLAWLAHWARNGCATNGIIG